MKSMGACSRLWAGTEFWCKWLSASVVYRAPYTFSICGVNLASGMWQTRSTIRSSITGTTISAA